MMKNYVKPLCCSSMMQKETKKLLSCLSSFQTSVIKLIKTKPITHQLDYSANLKPYYYYQNQNQSN